MRGGAAAAVADDDDDDDNDDDVGADDDDDGDDDDDDCDEDDEDDDDDDDDETDDDDDDDDDEQHLTGLLCRAPEVPGQGRETVPRILVPATQAGIASELLGAQSGAILALRNQYLDSNSMVLFSLYSASIWPIQLQDWKRNLTDYVSQIYLNTVGGKHASCLHAWRGKAVKPRASRLYRGKCSRKTTFFERFERFSCLRLLAFKQLRQNHLPAGKHHGSEGRTNSTTTPKNCQTSHLKS